MPCFFLFHAFSSLEQRHGKINDKIIGEKVETLWELVCFFGSN